jgi:hypothetical protein
MVAKQPPKTDGATTRKLHSLDKLAMQIATTKRSSPLGVKIYQPSQILVVEF